MTDLGYSMKKYICLLVAGATLLLTACEQLPGAINEAKREVRKSLIDPDSAKFEAVFEIQSSGAVCGFVNGKNRMGGYAGANPFVYEKNVGVTLVREPPKESDFERYFENVKYADSSEYTELENKCKEAALWATKCGSQIFPSTNKYCEVVNHGNTMMDVYELAKPSLNIY